MIAERMLPRPLRSAAFRFALVLAAVFAVGAFALLIAVWQQVGHYAEEATQGRLKAEAAVLAAEYDQLGRGGLIAAMARHQKAGRDAQFEYLLQDAQGRKLFGTLATGLVKIGWNRIRAVEEEPFHAAAAPTAMTALGKPLPGGLLLGVATDNFDVDSLRRRLGIFTLLCGVGISLFALGGGYFSGRIFLRRLDQVNHAVERISKGERAERLPMIGIAPEFDELARNLNRMLDRNEAAMDALRQVSTDIAHDLRTPLTRLHQRLEQMRDDHDSDAAMWEDALGQTQGLLATFHALLRIGTLEGGVGRRRFTRVDLSELMNRVHQAYQPAAEDAGHTLVADHAPGIGVDGDGELLAQSVINLIENAILHTPTGTVIQSRLCLAAGVPVIEVCDTGPGIPVDEHEHVFRRFYRLDAARHSEGAGLGLALVAAIAALHGADCGIPQTAEGLCVRLRFPKPESSTTPRPP